MKPTRVILLALVLAACQPQTGEPTRSPRPDLFTAPIVVDLTPTTSPTATPIPEAATQNIDQMLSQAPWLPALIALAIVLILSRDRLARVLHFIPWRNISVWLMGTSALVGLLAYQAIAIERANPQAIVIFQSGLILLAALAIFKGAPAIDHILWPPPTPSPTRNKLPLVITPATDKSSTCATSTSSAPLPKLFLSQGARVLITGPSRSGKSTILHHLCRRALTDSTFDEIILLDGKGPELVAWTMPGITYFGPDDFDQWVIPLEQLATGVTQRYSQLVRKGARMAGAGDPRKLIVIDEIQRATRTGAGGKITRALLTLSEQSGALRDVLLISTQRAIHRALDKSISINASLIITLRSPDEAGQFALHTSLGLNENQPTRQGQSSPVDDNTLAAWVDEIRQMRAKFAPPDGANS